MSPEDLLAKMVADIAKEVDEELADKSVPAHHHGRPIGYNNGCKGPLCRKAQRDRLRQPNGRGSANPMADAYLELRLTEHKKSLKNKKAKVA